MNKSLATLALPRCPISAFLWQMWVGGAMKTSLATLVLAALLTSGSTAPAQNAPAKIRPDRGNVIDSQITLASGAQPIVRQAFLNAPVVPLPKGTVLPSMGVLGPLGMDRMLSLQRHDFNLASRSVGYPVVAMMRCSNFPDTGEFVRVIATSTLLHGSVNTGAVLHAQGFVLEAKRAFHAGERIPSLRVVFQQKQFIFSLEATSESTSNATPQPLLSIVPEHLTPADRNVALEAWRLSNRSASQN